MTAMTASQKLKIQLQVNRTRNRVKEAVTQMMELNRRLTEAGLPEVEIPMTMMVWVVDTPKTTTDLVVVKPMDRPTTSQHPAKVGAASKKA